MARGNQASLQHETPDASPSPSDTSVPVREASRPFRLEDLLLLDPVGNRATHIEAIVFSDDGIGVIEHRGQPPRILPWSSVSAQAVEAWTGGVVPEWWVDPELDQGDPHGRAGGGPWQAITAADADARTWADIETGALLGIRTRTGTYRFLLPDTDPAELSRRVNAIAVVHRGQAVAPVTTVAGAGDEQPVSEVERTTWSTVQPYLVVALIAFIATSVTLILLQSAGAIHLPFLGGANSGSLGPLGPERLGLRIR